MTGGPALWRMMAAMPGNVLRNGRSKERLGNT